MIDNAENGALIGGIDTAFIKRDPMKLVIPNAQYRIEDIVTVMEDERALIGTDTGPHLTQTASHC